MKGFGPFKLQTIYLDLFQGLRNSGNGSSCFEWKLIDYLCTFFRMGRGIESRSFLFLLFVSNQVEKRRSSREEPKSTKGARNEERWRARERRIEEERPAGVSGMEIAIVV